MGWTRVVGSTPTRKRVHGWLTLTTPHYTTLHYITHPDVSARRSVKTKKKIAYEDVPIHCRLCALSRLFSAGTSSLRVPFSAGFG